MTSTDPQISGETRLPARRLAYWRYLGIAFAVFLVAGIVSGAIGALVKTSLVPVAAMVGVWLVTTVGFAWFARDYFRPIDELDLLDNLCATTIAFYVYIITLGYWLGFSEIGLVAPTEQYTIAAIASAAAIIAYCARKLSWR